MRSCTFEDDNVVSGITIALRLCKDICCSRSLHFISQSLKSVTVLSRLSNLRDATCGGRSELDLVPRCEGREDRRRRRRRRSCLFLSYT